MSIVRKVEDDELINFSAVFRLLLKKLYIIIICMAVVGGVFYAMGKQFIAPVYTAHVTRYVNNRNGAENINSNVISTADLSASVQLVNTYSAIITSDTALKEIMSITGIEREVSDFSRSIQIVSVNDTEVFQIMVADNDPEMAAAIANAFATVVPDQISKIVEGSSVRVIDMAEVPKEITSPNYTMLLMLGAILGLLASVIVIVARAWTDYTLKSEKDCEQWKYPVLSVIPDLVEAEESKESNYRYGARKVEKE